MSTADDINSVIKIKKIKQGLPSLPAQTGIDSTKGINTNSSGAEGLGMAAPLTLEILTYDDTQDVEVTTPTGTATIKTAETAQIIDANNKVWEIDTIIYPAAP